jgi:ABC-type microcin C transport system permease subunit YejB
MGERKIKRNKGKQKKRKSKKGQKKNKEEINYRGNTGLQKMMIPAGVFGFDSRQRHRLT